MTLYRRRKVWWVEYQVNGVRHRQSTHTRKYSVAKAWTTQIDTARKMPTFEEAVTVLKMFYNKPIEGLLPIESTWDVYIDLAKATGKAAIGKYTLYRRELALKRFIDWLKKERATITTIEAVTGPVAAGFATYLNKLGLKSKSRINNIAELSTIWKMLEHASTGVRNPWTALRPQNIDGVIGKAFTIDDEKRVLDAAKRVGKDWYPICVIMRHTGQRYGDVARLTWNEIDGDVIRLKPHKTTRHNITVTIPIIDPIRDVLKTIPKTGDYLFPLHAELYESRSVKKRELAFREVLDAAGLADSGYTVHSWRHTAATRLAESGSDIETRKALLGHRVDATAERYDHDEHLAAKRAALERAAENKKAPAKSKPAQEKKPRSGKVVGRNEAKKSNG